MQWIDDRYEFFWFGYLILLVSSLWGVRERKRNFSFAANDIDFISPTVDGTKSSSWVFISVKPIDFNH